MFDGFDFRKLMLLAFILALPILSLNLEKRDAGATRWYNRAFEFFVHPTQDFFTDYSKSVTDTTSRYLNLLDVKNENKKLKAELAELQQEVSRLHEVQIEIDRLKKQLDFQSEAPSKLVSAQVTGIDLLFGADYRSIRINKGLVHGVKPKMGVVTREGVIGYILRVSNDYSTVLLVTDRNSVVDVLVQRSRARGLVEGSGEERCDLKYLQRTDDVLPGDLVVTSGNDEIFPKGIPIGIVSKVTKRNYGVSQSVEMSPVVDITRLEEVYIIFKAVTPSDEEPTLTKGAS